MGTQLWKHDYSVGKYKWYTVEEQTYKPMI